MARGHQNHKNRDKNKQKLPQTPDNQKVSDGRDIEFAEELADANDLEAQKRSQAADQREKNK